METTQSGSDKGKVGATWTPTAEALLQSWRNRAYAAQSAYYLEAERLLHWHYVLGIAVVVMSTMAGSSMLTDKGSGISPMLIGLLGILAAILAGLQTFLKLGETATRNGVAADWYAAIRREIEELQVLPPPLRGDMRISLDAIRTDMNKAGQNAPALREHLWAKFAQRFAVDEPPLAESWPKAWLADIGSQVGVSQAGASSSITAS
jgi:hypothetical protein